MTTTPLSADLIADTGICNLILRVGERSLDVAVYSIVAEGSFIYRSIPLDTTARSAVEAVEESVYDNPLLLSPFRRTFCLVESRRYLCVPAGVEAEADAPLLRAQWPDLTGEPRTQSLATPDARMVWEAPSRLLSFATRTFGPQTAVMPHIAPLVSYFAMRPGHGNSARTIANLRAGSMDIITLRGPRLLQADTFTCPTADDALYFIMASRRALGLTANADEVMLAGLHSVREQLMPALRRYVGRVMPVIFPPQMFKAGYDAIQTPFDMIVTPLCE